jgi:Protein of unknown function (DUF4054)
VSVNTDCAVAVVPVHGVVVFDPAAFKLLYVQFATVADPTLTLYFDLATMILANTCGSIVSDATQRERLLNLLVAHIAALQPVSPAGGAGSGGTLVGRVASASEGTVSVTAEYASQVSASMAWFIQTQYGALFWQLTSSIRSFRYVAPCYGSQGPVGAFAGRRGY